MWQVPSTLSPEGENLIGVSHHLSWTLFIRNSETENDHPRVTTYVNKKLSKLQFSLWRDIYNHWDISLISFLNHGILYYLLNVYSDNQQNALKYLKDTEANLNNVIIITGNFNIRNSDWDPVYSYHSLHTDTLCEISDSLDCLPPSTLFPLNMQIIPKTQTRSLISCFCSLITENLINTRSSQKYTNHQIMPPLLFQLPSMKNTFIWKNKQLPKIAKMKRNSSNS